MAASLSIGFILPGRSIRQREGLDALIPDDVRVEYVAMGYQLAERGTSFDANIPFIGLKDQYVYRIPVVVQEHGWDAMSLVGGPVEMLNPGLLEDLRSRLAIPVATDLYACAMAVRAYDAQRVLVLTPWDDSMEKRVRAHLGGLGVRALSPSDEALKDHLPGGASDPARWAEAAKALDRSITTAAQYVAAVKQLMKPQEVLAYTRAAFREVGQGGKVDLIYFQATLDYASVLEDIEKEMGVPVINSSRLGPLWYLLSRLGRRYSIRGAGRLLAEWPALKEEI